MSCVTCDTLQAMLDDALNRENELENELAEAEGALERSRKTGIAEAVEAMECARNKAEVIALDKLAIAEEALGRIGNTAKRPTEYLPHSCTACDSCHDPEYEEQSGQTKVYIWDLAREALAKIRGEK